MDDDGNVVRAKTRSCGAGAETSSSAASRIVAHAAQQWRRQAQAQQACEQMVLTTLDLDRRDRDSELLALARLHAVTMLDASFLRGRGDGGTGRRRARSRSPQRALVREWAAAAASPRETARGAVEWLGESERQRVRAVRERVRMACQRYHGHGEEPPSTSSRLRADVVVTRMPVERQRELQGLSDHRAVSAFAHRGRIQSFLRGRFFRSGRPMNDEGLTARELGQLSQSNHPVSSRMREEVRSGTESGITSDQSTLVALSTRTNPTGNNEYDSVAPHHVIGADNNNHIENNANYGLFEILTQQSVQNEGSHIENINVANSNDAHQAGFAQEHIVDRYGEDDYSDDSGSSSESEQDNDDHYSSYAFLVPSNNGVQQRPETETYYDGGQESDESDLPWSTEDGHDDNTFVHRDEEWLVIDSQDQIEPRPNWQLGPSTSFPAASSRNDIINNRLIRPSDAGDVYGSIELRELLSRRSVSNLLSSGFRESLDQLIRSYVQRQEDDWNFEGQRPTAGLLLNEDPIEISSRIDGQQQNRAEMSDTTSTAHHQSSTQTTLYPQQRHHLHNWPTTQQSMHRSEFEMDILRDELTGVQRGMASMQQMLEACMEMQIELQRSIKQEVSAALNRRSSSLTKLGADEETMLAEDGSQWKLARKGTCCICCDNQIDSLLYRCGHMCTCSKCASELLLHGAGKCPLCRAPIIEVIRAYCIM